MDKLKIVAATTNTGKLKEIQAIFSQFDVLSLKDFNYTKKIIEDGKTFEENALKKAKIISQDLNMICIADDSGLCIDSLNGFPGVQTARFLNGSAHERNLAILEKLQNLQKEKRTATFTVSIAIADTNLCIPVSESLSGYISTYPRGANGFGFDEIFELEDGRTLAELSFDEKNTISCRKRALEAIRKYIKY